MKVSEVLFTVGACFLTLAGPVPGQEVCLKRRAARKLVV